MAGAVAQGVVGAVANRSRCALPVFGLAAPADDGEVRRILRENPMGGGIRLSLEREPESFAGGDVEGFVHQTVVGRRAGGGLFGMGVRAVRPMYVNGKRAAVGYLGSLRLDKDYRNSARTMVRGYGFLRQLHEAGGETCVYLTSVMGDNLRARRILEAGLPGMPCYRFVAEFRTLVIAAGGGKGGTDGYAVEAGREELRGEIARLINRYNSQFQFGGVWDTGDLWGSSASRGLAAEDYRCVLKGGKLVACAALWDQRAFRQSVVRGYGGVLGVVRPAVNAISRVWGWPPLPAVGQAIRNGFVSHVAFDEAHPAAGRIAIEAVRERARGEGLDCLSVGVAPGLSLPRGKMLRSRLYAVHWADGQAVAEGLDGRVSLPEVAQL